MSNLDCNRDTRDSVRWLDLPSPWLSAGAFPRAVLTIASAIALAAGACAQGELGDAPFESFPDARAVADAQPVSDARSTPDARPAPDARNSPDAVPPAPDAAPDAAAPAPDAAVASVCPPAQFATGFDAAGFVRCAPIDTTARASFEEHCELYAGWRNNCDGCTDPPTKWGRAGGTRCTVGDGADLTCTSPDLAGTSVALIGINTDGTVDDDDKFYLGFECTVPSDAAAPGPCAPGSFLVSASATAGSCVTGRAAVVEYLRGACDLYYGWRNNCDGCVDPPAKWGFTGSGDCTLGDGVDDSCGQASLGGAIVSLFGLNTDGEVGDDDKFYLGLRCAGATEATQTVTETCPAGQLVVGRDEQGQILCASPAPAAEAAVRASCFVYHGASDLCSGCTTPPQKWGRAGPGGCSNGAGADNTCTQPTLGGATVRLFGLNTDAEVGDDDTFYFGTRCL